jgi:predicted kinase
VDLIVIAGAPGVGKSTLAEGLRRRFGSPVLEFSALRQPHLDSTWSNATTKEHNMSWENLRFIVRNYVRYGYSNIVVTDLREERVHQVPAEFGDLEFVIMTLFISDDAELSRRITQREAGFIDVEAALTWNQLVRERDPIQHETKIEVDGKSEADLVELACSITV